MPSSCFDEYPGPEYYKARKKAVAEITKELVAKGLVVDHGKFGEVLHRKLRKRGF